MGTQKTKLYSAPAAIGFTSKSGTRGRQISTTGLCSNTLADIGSGSVAGTFQTLFTGFLNPGNSVLFPRVQAQASIFEKWRFKTLRFKLTPFTSTATTGVVGVYVDLDAIDSAATNIDAVKQNKYAVSGCPWLPLELDLTASEVRNKWYYVSPADASTADARSRQDSPGIVRVFCDKMAANVPIAMFEIEYEFEFTDARPPSALSATLNMGVDPVQNTSTLTATGGNLYLNWPQSAGNHLHGFSLSSMGSLVQLDSGDLNPSAIINANKSSTGELPLISNFWSATPLTVTAIGGVPGIDDGNLRLCAINTDGTLTSMATVGTLNHTGATWTITPANIAVAFTLAAGRDRMVLVAEIGGCTAVTGWTCNFSGLVMTLARNGAPFDAVSRGLRAPTGREPHSWSGPVGPEAAEWLEEQPPEYVVSMTSYPPARDLIKEEEDRIVQRVIEQMRAPVVCAEPPSPPPSLVSVPSSKNSTRR